MKRTEDVFGFPCSLELEKAGSGIKVWVRGKYTHVEESIPDLIAALQQFQETGTFVKPKRYKVHPHASCGLFKVCEEGTSSNVPLKTGLNTVWLPQNQAQRIADILNEEEE